CAMSWDFDYW
nr:immunoglobulin heavy chain junction region [Mus musculus]